MTTFETPFLQINPAAWTDSAWSLLGALLTLLAIFGIGWRAKAFFEGYAQRQEEAVREQAEATRQAIKELSEQMSKSIQDGMSQVGSEMHKGVSELADAHRQSSERQHEQMMKILNDRADDSSETEDDRG